MSKQLASRLWSDARNFVELAADLALLLNALMIGDGEAV